MSQSPGSKRDSGQLNFRSCCVLRNEIRSIFHFELDRFSLLNLNIIINLHYQEDYIMLTNLREESSKLDGAMLKW